MRNIFLRANVYKVVFVCFSMQENIKQWLDQAKADFTTARHCFTSKDYYAAVVFSQQCAEKVLKALYISNTGKLPPKVHDLVELGRLVDAPNEVYLLAEKLTVTYFSSRYPGAVSEIPAKFYDKKKASVHLKEAKVILQWVQQKIQ